jgi:hypothetical protein
MGGWADSVDFDGLNRHVRERRACRWLATGNGQKCMHLILRPDGPDADEHANLVDVHRSLARQGLVTVGAPNHFGWRWVNLTAAGWEHAKDHSQ